MGSIFEYADFNAIKSRIEVFSSSNKRKWGAMSHEQMLLHCDLQLRLALGEVRASIQGSSLMRTSIGKWIAFSEIPWPKGSATPNEMNTIKSNFHGLDLGTQKSELLLRLQQIRERDEFAPHPFFGELTKKEWGRLVYKHLDHHLKQFGG